MSPPNRGRPVFLCAAAALLTVLASGASAQSVEPGSGSPVLDQALPSPASDAHQDGATPMFTAPAIDETALARVSGREDRPTWQTANAQSSATVRDNSVGDNSPTGALSVSDSAFQNVSGISMVNLNTGNASSINASMNVNLSIHMAPVTAAPGGM